MFAGLIAIVALLHFTTKRIPAAILFWSAYVLTRPLGATLGDTLTKSHKEGVSTPRCGADARGRLRPARQNCLRNPIVSPRGSTPADQAEVRVDS